MKPHVRFRKRIPAITRKRRFKSAGSRDSISMKKLMKSFIIIIISLTSKKRRKKLISFYFSLGVLCLPQLSL